MTRRDGCLVIYRPGFEIRAYVAAENIKKTRAFVRPKRWWIYSGIRSRASDDSWLEENYVFIVHRDLLSITPALYSAIKFYRCGMLVALLLFHCSLLSDILYVTYIGCTKLNFFFCFFVVANISHEMLTNLYLYCIILCKISIYEYRVILTQNNSNKSISINIF